jgi:hypothetical protein
MNGFVTEGGGGQGGQKSHFAFSFGSDKPDLDKNWHNQAT